MSNTEKDNGTKIYGSQVKSTLSGCLSPAFKEKSDHSLQQKEDMRFAIAAGSLLLLSALPSGSSASLDRQFGEQVKAAMRSSLSGMDCCQIAGNCPKGYKLMGSTGSGKTLCVADKPITDCTSAASTDDYPTCEAAPTPSSTPASPNEAPPATGTCSNASGVCVCSGDCPGKQDEPEISIVRDLH